MASLDHRLLCLYVKFLCELPKGLVSPIRRAEGLSFPLRIIDRRKQ